MLKFDNVKIFTDNIDEKALGQLRTLAETGVFAGQPIRIMPDVHAGAGCVIGFTAPIKDKIIPNLVGVDIGCGMLCVELGRVDIDFAVLDEIIRKSVPSGRNIGLYSKEAHDFIERLYCKDALHNRDWLECSLGTLGGGNHFIEVDEDEMGCKYLVIHSGSRNLGKQVAEYYQDIAVKECRSVSTAQVIADLKAQGREREIEETIKRLKSEMPKLPKDLCYLQGKSMDDYLHDMQICTEFADKNRETIANNILYYLFGHYCFDNFTTRHNYISEDNYIRKGAIEAKKGTRVLIPLNMRDGCIIGVGKGNPDWNYSAPHGAGRIMSRGEARAQLELNDFEQSMKGIYTTSVNEQTIDEAPFCYKPAQEITDLVQDTIEIQHRLQSKYNFKASEEQDGGQNSNSFILELAKPTDDDKIFYRYRYRNNVIYFEQCQRTGNIYQVYVHKDEAAAIPYEVISDCREKFWPTVFEASTYSLHFSTIVDCDVMLNVTAEIKDLLTALYHFFESSDHARKYCDLHGISNVYEKISE